jgi:hypothetical protein
MVPGIAASAESIVHLSYANARIWSVDGMLREKSLNTLREICHSATFSSTNLTWTALGANPCPDPRSEKLAIHQLRCCMTFTLYTVAYVVH